MRYTNPRLLYFTLLYFGGVLGLSGVSGFGVFWGVLGFRVLGFWVFGGFVVFGGFGVFGGYG